MSKLSLERRHFEFIAEVIATTCDKFDISIRYDQRRIVANEFADRLADTNSNFDRHRFLVACGII